MNTLNLLIEAIQTRKPVSFHYLKKDKTRGRRTGNPYAVYLTDDGRKTMVHIFQTGGASDSIKRNPLESWRQFDISYLSELTIHTESERFILEDSYNPEWEGYSKIIEKV